MDITRVTVRKDANGHVFALFPNEYADVFKGYRTVFDETCGHRSADYDHCMNTSVPAERHEIKRVLRTLINVYGYENLRYFKESDNG